MTAAKELIVALDLEAAPARKLVERIGDAVDFYKVAPSLMIQDPVFIPWLVRRDKRVFLDCKWYDIPSQVQRSVQVAGRLGVASCTIHTGAGSAVMQAALAADPRPKIWGVTVLTSLEVADLKEVGISAEPAGQVLRLAALAQKAGLDGLVCSPHEVRMLRENGIRLPLVTPGIQYGESAAKDQKRTAGPQDAWSAGADYIVVGRSILEAPDPAETARKILELR